MPVLVFFFFYRLYPVVRYVHREPVIEAVASVLKRRCESRHTADILRYRDGRRIDLMDELVRQHQVAYRIIVLMPVEVVSISIEVFTETMTVVEHGCDTIEAESVKMKFLQPVFAV